MERLLLHVMYTSNENYHCSLPPTAAPIASQTWSYRGSQTTYLRVFYRDFNLLVLPEEDHDYVMVGGIFPTGYHATAMADVVYGGVPVGAIIEVMHSIDHRSQEYLKSQGTLQSSGRYDA
jgi:threonine dehydrogenase-like Zn-dependent dehydrogenase